MKPREKLDCIATALEIGQRVSNRKFKKMQGTGLYEIRVKTVFGIHRALGRFGQNKFSIGRVFHKKSQKTPKNEINLANRRINELE